MERETRKEFPSRRYLFISPRIIGIAFVLRNRLQCFSKVIIAYYGGNCKRNQKIKILNISKISHKKSLWKRVPKDFLDYKKLIATI